MSKTERHAKLLLGYYNYELMAKTVRRIFSKMTPEQELDLASEIIRQLRARMSDTNAYGTQQLYARWTQEAIDRVLSSDAVARRLNKLVQEQVDEQLENVIKKIVEQKLSNLTVEAIRALLKHGR